METAATQYFCRPERIRPGWYPFFAAVRFAGVRGRHRGPFECDDMTAVADDHAETVGGDRMPGDSDAGGGDDVEMTAADRPGDGDLRGC